MLRSVQLVANWPSVFGGACCRDGVHGVPSGEELEPLLGGAAGFGGVESRVVNGTVDRQVEGLVGELEVADVGVP
jgi:hypothetical protein